MTKTTDQQRIEIVQRYLAGENAVDIAPDYNITHVAVLGLLKRRNIKIRSQSQIQRKYSINETFFDKIDTQEKAYFLGFLYADGYNNTDRFSVNISLAEQDKEILIALNSLVQPKKPLQFIKMSKYKNSQQDQYRLVIANKHISQQLVSLGCHKAKTFTIKYPDWLDFSLERHFIRGYYDGDGSLSINKNSKYGHVSIVGTLEFILPIQQIFINCLGISSHIRTRHPERDHNIRMLDISGDRQIITFLEWLYKDATIYLKRKYDKFFELKKYNDTKLHKPIKICSVEGCTRSAVSKGYCRNHHYHLCGGKEKRHQRYIEKGC